STPRSAVPTGAWRRSKRERDDRDGTLAETGTFETVLLSTGEAPILSRGKGGMISRVVELEAPVVSDARVQQAALE
ncbi:MAG: hypothetical protein ABJA81_03305, partial [Nocardioidaceae bacterium]